MVKVVIHANPRQAHQVEFGAALWEGFKVHGINATVSSERPLDGDIHVVQGPWFTLDTHRHLPWVLYLDRCFYGDASKVVSLGWLLGNGARDFKIKMNAQPKGELPRIWPRKEYNGTCVVFADYGRDMAQEVAMAQARHPRVLYRPHPAETGPVIPKGCQEATGSLDDVFEVASAAIGHASTVLVDAVRHGLKTETTNPAHVVYGAWDKIRRVWLGHLSWAQWHLDECASGAFWEHLKPCSQETFEPL